MVFFSSTLYAQQTIQLPAVCTDSRAFEKVVKEYREEILFVGKDTVHSDGQLALSMFLNSKTGTYTVALIASDARIVCVISSGDAGKMLYNN